MSQCKQRIPKFDHQSKVEQSKRNFGMYAQRVNYIHQCIAHIIHFHRNFTDSIQLGWVSATECRQATLPSDCILQQLVVFMRKSIKQNSFCGPFNRQRQLVRTNTLLPRHRCPPHATRQAPHIISSCLSCCTAFIASKPYCVRNQSRINSSSRGRGYPITIRHSGWPQSPIVQTHKAKCIASHQLSDYKLIQHRTQSESSHTLLCVYRQQESMVLL